jgi:hypothetical protein
MLTGKHLFCHHAFAVAAFASRRLDARDALRELGQVQGDFIEHLLRPKEEHPSVPDVPAALDVLFRERGVRLFDEALRTPKLR